MKRLSHLIDLTRVRRQSGFTLPEVLASGVLGAMLLTALAYATFEFALGVTYMEQKAGITDGEDMVLRRLTRDIREAWWAELVHDQHIRLADPDGNYTDYYFESGDLKVQRPNGDQGALFSDLSDLTFETQTTQRLREGPALLSDAIWYDREIPVSTAVPLEVAEGGVLALAFQAPHVDDELPAGSVPGNQALLSMSASLLSLPLAWVPGTDPEDLVVQLYESWAPGSAKPLGTAIGSAQIAGATLPPAVWNGSSWDVPTVESALNVTGLGSNLQPGVGYTLLLQATGDAQIVVEAFAELPISDRDDVALKDPTPGSSYVNLPLAVPFSVSGPYTLTSSTPTTVVTGISITLVPDSGPVKTRSATLLGQSLSDDPWAGVVPGELPP